MTSNVILWLRANAKPRIQYDTIEELSICQKIFGKHKPQQLLQCLKVNAHAVARRDFEEHTKRLINLKSP